MQVYAITNLTNGKKYVGQTVKSLHRRFMSHSTQPGYSAIKNAILKYGRNNFTIECLHICNSKEEMDRVETDFIKSLNTYKPFGYNLRRGGGSRGSHDEEARAKIRNSWENRKVSKATCKKMSDGQKLLMKQDPILREKRMKALERAWMNPPWKGKPAHNRKSILCLETGTVFQSAREAAKLNGGTASNICRVCIIKKGTVKGFTYRHVSSQD